MSDLAKKLAQHPLFWIGVTLLAWQIGVWCHRRSGQHILIQPILIALLLTAVAVTFVDVPFDDYYADTRPIHLLLGPVTVALAVPLYFNLRLIARLWLPLTVALLLTGITAVALTVLIAKAFGAPELILATLAPKSVTGPIAMLVAHDLAGLPGLAAVLVLLTGVAGAVIGPPLLHRFGVQDDAAVGFALGLSAHAVGTARAFAISDRCGAFAALDMGLMGVTTAILLPLAWPLFF